MANLLQKLLLILVVAPIHATARCLLLFQRRVVRLCRHGFWTNIKSAHQMTHRKQALQFLFTPRVTRQGHYRKLIERDSFRELSESQRYGTLSVPMSNTVMLFLSTLNRPQPYRLLLCALDKLVFRRCWRLNHHRRTWNHADTDKFPGQMVLVPNSGLHWSIMPQLPALPVDPPSVPTRYGPTWSDQASWAGRA